MVEVNEGVGSIGVGKKADLVVIDRNILEIPADELPEVNVQATMVDGRVVLEEAVDWEPTEEWWLGIDIHHTRQNARNWVS